MRDDFMESYRSEVSTVKEMKPDNIIYLGKNTPSIMRGICPVCRQNVYKACNFCSICGTKLLWPSIDDMEKDKRR